MIFKYTFEDGTILRLRDVGLSCEEVWKLGKLHGKCKVESTDEERGERNRRCKECKYNKSINAQEDWWFIGCYCKPYRGKWVAEIEKCPLAESEE